MTISADTLGPLPIESVVPRSNFVPTVAELTPTAQLDAVLAKLDPMKATIVGDGFARMFAKIEGWSKDNASIVVTSAEDKRQIVNARALRLEIKVARTGLEKRRKEMKEAIIREGKAIDAAYAIFESFAVPLEKELLEKETFVEREEKAREEQLRKARAETLSALGVSPVAFPAELGKLGETEWDAVLDNAKIAKEARERRAAEQEQREAELRQKAIEAAEEARVAAEKKGAELVAAQAEIQRKAQASVEAQYRGERAELERRAAEETAARAKAEEERDAAVKAVEVVADRKPTKAKYGKMVGALLEIASINGDDLEDVVRRARGIAENTLKVVGEWEVPS